MKITAGVVEFLIGAVIALMITLVITAVELQRCKNVLREAQTQVDTIYRGTALAAEYCEQMIEEAKCKPL